MEQSLEMVAGEFFRSLRPREPFRIDLLKQFLTLDETDAIESVLEDRSLKEILSEMRLKLPHLARLQLLIGLEFGTVSEQVRTAILKEMGQRDWGWRKGTPKQVLLSRATGVSVSQVSRFLRGGIPGRVRTSTLDRLCQVVGLEVVSHGAMGRLYDALSPGVREPSQKRGRQLPGERNDLEEVGLKGSISGQIRQLMIRLMKRRSWSQGQLAGWTCASQSQISRFLNGGSINTDTLDGIGAFLWVELVQRAPVDAQVDQ